MLATWKGIGQSNALKFAGDAASVGGVVWNGYSEYQNSIDAGEGNAMTIGRGAAGAAIGSVFPGVGTAAGFLVGLGVGAVTSYFATSGIEAAQSAIVGP